MPAIGADNEQAQITAMEPTVGPVAIEILLVVIGESQRLELTPWRCRDELKAIVGGRVSHPQIIFVGLERRQVSNQTAVIGKLRLGCVFVHDVRELFGSKTIQGEGSRGFAAHEINALSVWIGGSIQIRPGPVRDLLEGMI